MPRVSPEWYAAYLAKTGQREDVGVSDRGCAEGGTEIKAIHDPILRWCQQQHPLPAVIHCRPDRETGSTLGAPDFVIIWKGHVLLIEAKTKEGKLSEDQRIWHHLSHLNGFDVHICRSFDQFLELVSTLETPATR